MAVTQAQREAFFAQALPYAQEGHRRTGIPVSVILAQWGLESAYGTSYIAKQGSNYAGIKLGSAKGNQDGSIQSPDGSGPYGLYASWDRFTNHWSAILEDSAAYAGVRQAVAAGSSPEAVAVALGTSPWAESGYKRSGQVGQGLLDVIKLNGLDKYDPPTYEAPATWTDGRWTVRPTGAGYQVTAPPEALGLPWAVALGIVALLGMGAVLSGKKESTA